MAKRSPRAKKPATIVPTQTGLIPKVLKKLADQLMSQDSRISEEEVRFTMSFLKYFGYLPDKPSAQLNVDDHLQALTAFQQRVGLSPTGQLDIRTANAMQAPRCGLSDVNPLKLQMAMTGEAMPIGKAPKWTLPVVKWCLVEYVPNIPQQVQWDIVETAYKNWAAVCGLKIEATKDQGQANILIGTGRGPRNQFDGPGNTLAWAHLPPGDNRTLYMLFDLDESWVAELTGTPREIRMLNVVTHEGGHTLGLEHSTVNSALMAPYYAAQVDRPISPDDVERIQRLYGPPTAQPTPSPGPGSATAPGELNVTVSTSGPNGIVFKGRIQKVN